MSKYKFTSKKLNIVQKRAIVKLLNHNRVEQHHKNILRGIKGNNFKNVSQADNDIVVMLFQQYEPLLD